MSIFENLEVVELSIVYKLSRDPQLLEQYYQLREQCFRKELGLPFFDGSEEEQDRQGQILLAVQDGRCIAGARISSAPLLPAQAEHLAIVRNTCCVWERLVFDSAVRALQLCHKFCGELIETSREAGYHHAVVFSSLRNARFYRQCHSAQGVEFKIHSRMQACSQSAFSGLEHYLSIATLRESAPVRIAA